MISMEKYLSKEDNETAAYKALLREIEERENDYENFKTSLNENEQNLAKVIEEKLTSISNAKIEFLTLKHQDELKLKIASLKLVMSSISSASAKCLSDETCEKITRIQTELSDLKSDLGSKCNEVLSYRNEIQILEKATNELRRQLAERESHIESLKVKESSYLSELNELKDRLHDQNDDEVAINIEREDANSMSQEDHYVSTTTTVHQQHQTSDLISFESATTTIIIAPPDESSDGESAAMESCCSSMTPRTNHEPNNPAIGATILIQRAPNQADVESSFKTRYFELRDSIEKLSHPVFIQFENELEAKHRKEYEKIKLSYEKKLNDEIDFYKKHIIELEEKQKKEIENLEKEFNQVLSSDLDELKKELEKSSQNQGIGIKFRYVSERRQREITDSNDFNMYFDETIPLNNNNNNGEERRNSENYSICRNISVTSTTLNDEDNKTPRQQQQQQQREKENRSDENKEEQKERRTTREDDEVLLIEHEMPIVNSSSSNENSLLSSSQNGSSSGSSSDHDGENGNKADAVLFEKIIEIEPAETTNTTTTTSNGAATYEKKLKREILTSENYVKIKEDLLIDELEKKEKQIQELDERLKQVLMKNETLQNTLKSLYEKDDVFMASIRRENEERDNSLRLLQSELDKSTIQSNTLQMKNQNLSNLLSKISLITSTIEDHVNRRFNRILVNNSTVFAGCLAITSPKNVGGGTSSTSGESGLTGSSDMVANTAHINDADSNDDDGLSDDGDLDYSQKFSGGEFAHHNHHHNAHSPNDHGSSEHLNDDMFIEASVKLQTSIDKVMNKFEELSSQFPDAQVQLIMKLEETEKAYAELRAKLDASEAESRERVEELQTKIDNLEGLVNAHEMDKDAQMRRLAALEDDLADANKQLENARNQIECDKYELSSLENLRKDWEAQRSCLTRDLQDSDLKALIENNSQLLDETHELKYMMKKTNEKQEQQIRELESSIEQSNYENKLLKEQYEEKIHELRKQMESMEAQIRSERGFIESQMSEREQEREDYEKKINELKQLLTKKSTDMFEAEDAVSNRIKELSIQLQEKSDRVNQLLLETEQLERNVNEKENGLQSQAHTLKEAEKRLQTLSTEKEELEKKVEQLNEDMNALLKANKAHADVINSLKESLNESVAKSKEYIDARDNWIKEKEDLVQEKTNIQNQMYRYMNELSEMKLFKENIDMEHMNQIKLLEDKINSLSAAIDDKEHQNEKLQETVNELHADFQTKLDLELKSELDQLKNLQEQNDSQISQSYESQIDRLKTEIAALKDEIDSKEKAIESEKKAFDNMIQNLVDNKNETIEELNEEMDKLKKKSADEAEKMRDELRARDDKIERLEGELVRITAEMASCKDGYEIQIGNLNENFKNQLETFNDLIEKLKVEKEAFYAETETLKAETASLKETNRDLTARDQKMTENEAKLNAKISELSNEISSIGTELELANQSVLTKEQIIETLNADIEEIRAQLSQTENELQEKRENFENLEKDLQSNLNKLESIEMRNKELNDELLKARSMLEKSRSDSDCQTDWTEDEKHSEQIEVLKAQHLSELESLRANLEEKSRVEIERLENTLKAEYEKQMAQLKDQYEREMDESDNSTSADISASNDNFKKLREQIKRSKELDEEILGKMNEKMTDSSTKKPTEAIPNEIKEILDKLENEGILLLSMSEIMRLKSHIQSQNSSSQDQQPQQQQQQEINSRLKAVAIENEKDQLIMEIYKLRHLLSDIKNLNNLCTSLDESDWRSAILKAISDIFLNQKEHLLAELRSFISNNGFTQQSDYVAHLENKIDDLTKLNAKSMEYLISIDRESFQKEIEALKQKNKKLQEQVAALQESDRELKRSLKLMEYEKDTEAIKGNDMKQSLNAERSKCLELTDKLNQEQKKANSMQEQLSQLNEEVAAFKRSLNEQTTSLEKICKELDAERIKNDQLNTLLEKKSSSRGYEQDENDFSKENQIHRMYLRNSNSGEQQQKSNGGVNGGERQRSSSSMLIDNQIIELEKHANSLHNLLAQEKEKNQKLTKALNDLKNNYIKVASAEIQSNAMNMERIRQSLEYLALKHRDKLDSTSSSSKQQKYVTELKSNLADIISELENLDKTTMPATAAASRSLESAGGEEVVSAPSALEVRLLQQNKEMLKSIKSLSTEKLELKSNLTRLEEEIWNYKNKYKNEINTLTEHDREKFKKLYYKYLRAESFRKSLVYQKRFLLIMLNGYEETEREIIATLENNLTLKNQILTNNNSSSQYAHTVVNNHHNNRNGQQQQQICTTVQQHVDHKNASTSYYYSSRFMVKKPKSRFRTGVICVIAISRIKFLQRKHSHIISSKN